MMPRLIPCLAIVLMLGCAPPTLEEEFSLEQTLEARTGKDAWMRDDPSSPFNHEKHPVGFSPLHYFEPDSEWVFQSKLTVMAKPEPITIFDTKGRERAGDLYGSLTFKHDGRTHQVRVYRMVIPDGHYYGIWFTDRTTGDSTYEVGRYLDFEFSADSEHLYTLDFNGAYNPYCAYSPAHGCAIPREEDFLDLAIVAGEKRWHD